MKRTFKFLWGTFKWLPHVSLNLLAERLMRVTFCRHLYMDTKFFLKDFYSDFRKHEIASLNKATAILVLLLVFLVSFKLTPNYFQTNIKAAILSEKPIVVSGRYLSKYSLYELYATRGFSPIWLHNRGLRSYAKRYIKLLEYADIEGLNPKEYGVKPIKEFIDQGVYTYELELLISHSVLRFIRDLGEGRHYLRHIFPEEFRYKKEVNPADILEDSLIFVNPQKMLRQILPKDSRYQSLKDSLSFYREIQAAGGWSKIKSSRRVIKPETTNSRISDIRKRLQIEGFISKHSRHKGDFYDDELALAIKSFKASEGMRVSEGIGSGTIKKLNVSVERKIKKIMMTLERFRWMPRDFGEKRVEVNIPNYFIHAYEDDKIALKMRAVIGRASPEENRTPIFSSVMNNVTFNPPWYVPRRIAMNSYFPRLKQGTEFLSGRNFELMRRRRRRLVPVKNPELIDFSQYTEKNFPFVFVQSAGKGNSLGRIKFSIINDMAIYLHDTNKKKYFKYDRRDKSSGCIRVERPLSLAYFALKKNSRLDEEDIDGFYKLSDKRRSRKNRPTFIATKIERLKDKIPVHIYYWTAFVDQNGRMHFRKDIYGWDDAMMDAL
ncbi:MAG: L,D-transpeptidase family protein [Alphaproteobacteria bacterium]